MKFFLFFSVPTPVPLLQECLPQSSAASRWATPRTSLTQDGPGESEDNRTPMK